MLAATRGIKTDAFGVVDFMPADSMRWVKRSKQKSRGITSSKAQTPILLRSFGFK